MGSNSFYVILSQFSMRVSKSFKKFSLILLTFLYGICLNKKKCLYSIFPRKHLSVGYKFSGCFLTLFSTDIVILQISTFVIVVTDAVAVVKVHESGIFFFLSFLHLKQMLTTYRSWRSESYNTLILSVFKCLLVFTFFLTIFFPCSWS